MPRVKVDYVVSFSSEDSDNQASNLLALEISKKKWLCSKGEPSCSVVLQLSKAVKISAVHLGSHHAALVEVLVGLSEKPNDQYQVLVPSSVFLTPTESRRDDNVSRVRSFSAEQLSSDAREKRWDRVRVVCSQPYNKHCKYGLSFIHIFESEDKPTADVPPAPLPVPKRLLSIDTQSSDEDDFKPGELFAKHLQKPVGDTASTSTDAQIRKATSHALKNIPDSSTKLTKAPIEKTHKRANTTDDNGDDRGANRQRTNLMYTDDDDQPNPKIDRVVNRHNDEKEKQAKDKHEDKKNDKGRRDDSKQRKHDEISTKKDDKKRRRDDSSSDSQQRKHDESSTKKEDKKRYRDDSSSRASNEGNKTPRNDKQRNRGDSSRDDGAKTPQTKRDAAGSRDSSNRKRGHSDERAGKKTGLRAGPVTDSPDTLLSDVVFVLSGYENPRRGAVRDAALCMGATMQRDWTPSCTHLICAFPNTPKMKAVRASPQSDSAVIVTAEWVEQCCATRRRLPWQWFATEPGRRVLYSDSDLRDTASEAKRPAAESDSDDEAAAQRNIKKQRRDASPSDKALDTKQCRHSNRSPSPRRNDSANISTDSDVAFVRDERIKGNVTIADSDSDATDEETSTDNKCAVDEAATLPDFFDGYTFAIDDDVDTTLDKSLLGRYVRAYGGVLIEASQIDDDTGVDYLLCARAVSTKHVKGKAVRADWVWRCHEEKQRWPLTDYALS